MRRTQTEMLQTNYCNGGRGGKKKERKPKPYFEEILENIDMYRLEN